VADFDPKEVIRDTVKAFGGGRAAEEMLFFTGAAESGYRVTRQYGGGPALGYWQMEPATEKDIWDNFLRFRPSLAEKVRATGEQNLETNPAYAAAMARVHYMRVKDPLPSPGLKHQQALYWKQFYNTPAGRGTVNHFMKVAGKFHYALPAPVPLPAPR